MNSYVNRVITIMMAKADKRKFAISTIIPIKKNGFFHPQQGSLLLDALIAMLLFSMGFIGLLKYQKALVTQQVYLERRQQAWRFAQQALEVYPLDLNHFMSFELDGWTLPLSLVRLDDQCQLVTVRVSFRQQPLAELSQLFCKNEFMD